MPDCPHCDTELEDDALRGTLWCWLCHTEWVWGADGLLYPPAA